MSESRHSQYLKNTPTVSWKGTLLHFQTYPLSIWRACEVSRRFCPLSPVVGRSFGARHATRDNGMKQSSNFGLLDHKRETDGQASSTCFKELAYQIKPQMKCFALDNI